MIFYRENLRYVYAKWLGTVFILLIGGCYGLKLIHHANLLSLSIFQMSVTFFATVGALLILWRHKVRLYSPLLLSLGVFAAYWIQFAFFRF